MKRILSMLITLAAAPCFAQTTTSPCINVPLSLTADSKQVTVGNTPPNITNDKVYVYYHRRKQHKRPLAPEFADITDQHASNPVLVNITKNMQVAPQSYKFTVNTPQDHVVACPDSTLNMAANINIEKVSEYSGYYPATAKKNYKLVSRRVYRKTSRKMCKAERKQRRVSHLTGVSVEVPANG